MSWFSSGIHLNRPLTSGLCLLPRVLNPRQQWYRYLTKQEELGQKEENRKVNKDQFVNYRPPSGCSIFNGLFIPQSVKERREILKIFNDFRFLEMDVNIQNEDYVSL